MAKTDGYITNSSGGSWLTSNTGSGSGDASSAQAAAYARLEHPEAPIPGTKVDGNGQVSEGPSVSFTDPGGLLSGAAAAQGDRPYIVWAGVSPLSLSEALIVWNTSVVLLDKSGVTGGDVTSMSGRLMVINLGGPVKINGKEKKQITIKAGAVGFYKADGGPGCDDPPAPQAPGGGGGDLDDPEDPEPSCDCGEVVTGDGGGGGGGGGGGEAQQLVFSTICNPAAQCGDFEGNKASFVVNNQLSFPVRCTHPFYLEKLKTNFACSCENCERDAQVWEACYELYGATLPGECFPLDQLQDIDVCSVGSKNNSNGYPATLRSDVACGVPCPTASVEIYGAWGPTVVQSGRWRHTNPGFAGQQVTWTPPCDTICDVECQSPITVAHLDCFVAEDIIKPVERTVPVSFFEDWTVETTALTIPSTLMTTAITALTSIETEEIEFVNDITTKLEDVVTPPENGAWVDTEDQSFVEVVDTLTTDAAEVLKAANGDLVTNYNTEVLTFKLLSDESTEEVALEGIKDLSTEDEVVTLLVPVTDGQLVSNLTTRTDEHPVLIPDPPLDEIVTDYPVVLEDVSVVTQAFDFVTDVVTSAITFADEVQPGDLVSSVGYDTLTVCDSDGNSSTVEVVTTIVTIEVAEKSEDVAIDAKFVELAPAFDVDPTEAIGNEVTVFGNDASTISIEIPEFELIDLEETNLTMITDINTTAADVATVTIPEFTDSSVTVGTFDTVAVETTEITIIEEFATTSILEVKTVDVETTEITLIESFETTSTIMTSFETVEHEITVPEDELEVTVVIEGSEITLITTTDTSGCDVTYRFLNHDGQIDWTDTNTTPPNCCDQPAQCNTNVQPHPDEENCTALLMLRANYVKAPSSGTANSCPCYDCSSESCEDGAEPVEPPGSSRGPCTVRVRRVNRRWCVNRDCN